MGLSMRLRLIMHRMLQRKKHADLRQRRLGVIGLETAFPLLYTELVLRNLLSLDASCRTANLRSCADSVFTDSEACGLRNRRTWCSDLKTERVVRVEGCAAAVATPVSASSAARLAGADTRQGQVAFSSLAQLSGAVAVPTASSAVAAVGIFAVFLRA